MMRNADVRYGVILLGLSVLLWASRLSGPIDLRWDAGVYYVLGTSLAEGKGYRLLNEPGEIQAIQYPPLLPALVAAHELALGTSDPDLIAQPLRRTYFIIFILYVLGAYVMARQYLAGTPAFFVGLMSALPFHVLFLSDMLFSEMPFAVVTLAFAIINARGDGWRCFIPAALLGVMAYLLRTAGIALLAAWVAESLVKKRWRQAAMRAVVSLIPIIAWQAYIKSVTSGEEYKHPAYAYQRAPYQLYNVGYAENSLLIDSFAPERGRVTASALAVRVLNNLASMPSAVTEALIGGRRTRDLYPSLGLLFQVSYEALGWLVIVGMGSLVARRIWFIPLYLVASLLLMCLTPWPWQFNRYLAPLCPFLTLSLVHLVLCVAGESSWLRSAKWRRVASTCLGAVIAIVLAKQAITAVRSDRSRLKDSTPARGAPGDRSGQHFLLYDLSWASFGDALEWLKARAEPGDVVAAMAAHFAYLETGLKTVMAPMEPDTAKAQALLDSVPVKFVILDSLHYLDSTKRYTVPAIKSNSQYWELVYTTEDGMTSIYRRKE